MSRRKANGKHSRGSDPQLADKVRSLRSSLGISQAKLAEMLKINRSQVAEWETNGDERPSVEKLLEMARLSPITDLRRWLWIKAGVDLETIRRDFHEEVALAIDPAAAALTFEVPLFDAKQFRIRQGRSLRETAEGIVLPVQILPHPTSTICLRCETCPPWSTSADDLVVIDQAVTDADALIGKMTAIFACPLPPQLGRVKGSRRSTRKEPGNASEAQQPIRSVAMRREAVQARDTLVQDSGLIIGRLDVQHDNDEISEYAPNCVIWRLVLRLGLQASRKQVLPLSYWQLLDRFSTTGLAPLIHSQYQLVGEVVVWIKDPKGSSKE